MVRYERETATKPVATVAAAATAVARLEFRDEWMDPPDLEVGQVNLLACPKSFVDVLTLFEVYDDDDVCAYRTI